MCQNSKLLEFPIFSLSMARKILNLVIFFLKNRLDAWKLLFFFNAGRGKLDFI
jgi:hypothetical protein